MQEWLLFLKSTFNQSVLDIFKQECSILSLMQRYKHETMVKPLMKRLMFINLFFGISRFSDQDAIFFFDIIFRFWKDSWIFSCKIEINSLFWGFKNENSYFHKDLCFSFLWRLLLFVINFCLSSRNAKILLWKRWQLTKLLSLTFWCQFSN